MRQSGYDRDLGYARVSTTGQDLDGHLAALGVAGADVGRVFIDMLSGSARTARPGLAAMLDYARAGDTVVVTAIDRLGRSVAEVTRTIAELGERRILLRALRDNHRHTDRPRRGGHHGNSCRTRTRARSRAPRRVAAVPPCACVAGYDRRSSLLTAKNNFADLPRPESPSRSWPRHSA